MTQLFVELLIYLDDPTPVGSYLLFFQEESSQDIKIMCWWSLSQMASVGKVHGCFLLFVSMHFTRYTAVVAVVSESCMLISTKEQGGVWRAES